MNTIKNNMIMIYSFKIRPKVLGCSSVDLAEYDSIMFVYTYIS